jgi:mevalonate kinase
MKLSVPSKTFLVGEYAVLHSGPAVLLTAPPFFSYDTVSREFADPYNGLGGFGASSARFVLEEQAKGITDPWEIWQRFRQSGLSGSGADAIAQSFGGMVFFHPAAKQLEKLAWPTPDLSVALIHTGNKLPTHEHLAALALRKQFNDITSDELSAITLSAYQACKTSNGLLFIKAINDYAEKLLSLNLVAETTLLLLNKCRMRNDVLAAKGCGAMGSDVILLIIPTAQKNEIIDWAKQEQLNLIFCGNEFYGTL